MTMNYRKLKKEITKDYGYTTFKKIVLSLSRFNHNRYTHKKFRHINFSKAVNEMERYNYDKQFIHTQK